MTFRPLSKELQEVAKNELNEASDRVQDDLNYIRQWLITKPHLKVRRDDQWLLSYLRACKFNLDRTKSKLELYHAKKIELPEFFANRDPLLPEIQEILKRGVILVLPKTSPAGHKIILMRASRAHPVLVPVVTFVKLMLMSLEILYLEDDNAVVSGICYLTDLEDTHFKYITQLTPNFLKKATAAMLSAFPIRLKGGFFINSPSFFQIVVNLMRLFLPLKLKSRLQVFNDVDDVSELIPKCNLPKEYGGQGPSCDEIAADWKRKIESYRDWFLDGSLERESFRSPRNHQPTVDTGRNFGNLEID